MVACRRASTSFNLERAWFRFTFNVSGLGLRVKGVGFRVQGLGLRVEDLGLMVEG